MENIDTRGTVVIDFYADWCAPCHKMHPIINELAEENPDVLFVKVDMEDPKSIDLAMKYKVSALPTLVFIRDGELLGATVGLYPKENIQNLIYDFLL